MKPFFVKYKAVLEFDVKTHVNIQRHNWCVDHPAIEIISERILCINNRVFLRVRRKVLGTCINPDFGVKISGNLRIPRQVRIGISRKLKF